MANLGMYGGGLTLKALLENPDLQSAPTSNKVEKEKKENDLHQFDASSAFLGPNLWDKTYDNTDINLEYMDLDEFLSENGIPVNFDALGNEIGLQSPTPSNASSDSRTSVPIVTPVDVSPGPSMMPSSPTTPRSSPPLSPKQPAVASPVSPAPAINSTVLQSPPQSPKSVDFSVSNDDIALVNITGEDNFDPRKRTFSEEELKPQPMIKKSKKIFIHDEAKDDKYWARRKKNNVAAKRSRDARRIKENQIAMRAAFLEKENSVLRTEMEKIKKENLRLKTSLSKYEPAT